MADTTVPLVSVVVPTLNSETTIGKCVRSILDQSYKGVEVIVVDLYSKDETGHIAERMRARAYTRGRERGAQVNFRCRAPKKAPLATLNARLAAGISRSFNCLFRPEALDPITQRWRIKRIAGPSSSQPTARNPGTTYRFRRMARALWSFHGSAASSMVCLEPKQSILDSEGFADSGLPESSANYSRVIHPSSTWPARERPPFTSGPWRSRGSA